MNAVIRWIVLAALATAACSGDVPATNPFDPQSPAEIQRKARVDGAVVLEAAASYAGAKATFTEAGAEGAPLVYVAETLADGTFSLELPRGAYNATIERQGYAGVQLNGLSLAAGERRSLGTFTLAVGRGAMRGLVVLDDQGSPAGTAISLIPLGNAAAPVVTVLAGADGSWFADRLAVGGYALRAEKESYAPAYTAPVAPLLADEGGLELSLGETVTAPTLRLYPASAIVQAKAGGQVNAPYTNQREIEVQLLAFVQFLTEMRVSEATDFAAPAWDTSYRQFTAQTSFTLGDQDGAHPIHGQFKDSYGLESTLFSTSIVLDRGAPVIGQLVINGGASFLTAADGAGAASVTLAGSDSLSGVSAWRTTLAGAFSDEPFLPLDSVGATFSLAVQTALGDADGEKVVRAQIRDRAGNLSELAAASIFRDKTPPALGSPALALDPADTATDGAALRLDVLLTFDVTGDRAGEPLFMAVANAPGLDAGSFFVPFSSPYPWRLLAGPDTMARQVCAIFKDLAGLVTGQQCLPVRVDRTGRVAGQIRLEGQGLHGGALVELFDPSDAGTVYTDVTTSSGSFRLTGVPGATTYTLRITKTGFSPLVQRSLLVVTGSTLNLDGPLVLELSRGAVLGVVSLAGRTDASGATVELVGTPYAAAASSAGAFLVERVPVGVYALRAGATGYLAAVLPSVAVTADGISDVGTLSLALNPATVTGTVLLETDTGSDVANASGVTVSVPGTSISAQSAGGAFTLNNVPPGARTVRATLSGYDPAEVQIVLEGGENRALSPLRLVLQRGTVAGRVDLAGRADDSGARVELVGTPYVAFSAADGTFRLDRVPAGAYTLRAGASGFLASTLALNVANRAVSDTGTLSLAQNPGTITGTVALEDVAAPTDVTVSVVGTSITAQSVAGAFSLNPVPPGVHTVRATRAGYEPAEAAGLVVDGGATVAIPSVLRLARSRGAISGKATLQGEASHEGIQVQVAPGLLGITARDGTYLVPSVPVGSYLLVAEKGAAYNATSSGSLVVVGAAGVTAVAPDMVLTPVPGSIRGVAERAGQADPSGINVLARGFSLGGTLQTKTTVTDSVGLFQLTGLLAGTYTVQLSSAGYKTLDLGSQFLQPAGLIDLGDLSLEPATGDIAGQIALSGQTSHGGVRVSLTQSNNERAFTYSDTSGNYRMADVPAGDYALSFTLTGYGTERVSSVVVSPDQVTNVGAVTLVAQVGEVSIVGATAATNKATVQITGTYPGAVRARFCEDPAVTDPETFSLATCAWRALTFALGGPGFDPVNATFKATACPDPGDTTEICDGAKSWWVRFADAASVDSNWFELPVTLDRRAPSGNVVIEPLDTTLSGGFVQDGGAPYIRSLTATVLVVAADDTSGVAAGGAVSGVVSARIYRTATDSNPLIVAMGDEARTFQGVSLAAGPDGPRALILKLTDAAGNDSVTDLAAAAASCPDPRGTAVPVRCDRIFFDITPVQSLRLSVNPVNQSGDYAVGAAYAVSPLVQLGIDSTSDGASEQEAVEAVISNDVNFTATLTQPLSAPRTLVNWFLSAGDGPKTVYLKVRDRAGNLSAAFSDGITLDTVTPDTPGLNPVGAVVANRRPRLSFGAVSGANSYRVQLSSTATFDGSGPVRVDVTQTANFYDETSDLPQGTHHWRVKALDNAGHESPFSAADVFTVDTVAPAVPVLVPVAPDPSSNASPSFAWSTLSDASSYSVEWDTVVTFNSVNRSARTTTASVTQPTLPLADGGWFFRVTAADLAGNRSAASSADGFSIDTVAPGGPGLTITENDTRSDNGYTNQALVTLRLSAGGNPATALVAENAGLSGAQTVNVLGLAQPVSATYTLGGAGARTVWVRFYDAAGNASNLASATVTLDQTPPSRLAAALVPSGYTTATAVQLVPPSSGQDDLLITGNLTAPTVFTAAPAGVAIPVTLTAGNGTKSIAVTYRDLADNTDSPPPLSIVLDGQAPSAFNFAVTGTLGDGTTSGAFTATPGVTLDLSAQTDLVSGIAEMKLSNLSTLADAAWEPFVSSSAVPWVLVPGDGAKTIYALFRDRAGMTTAAAVTGTITLAATPPSGGSVVINNGADSTINSSVDLVIGAVGASEMLISVDGVALGSWVTLASSMNIDLGSAEGRRVVSVRFRNAARLEGGSASASILRDRTAPGSGTVSLVGSLGNGLTSNTYSATPAVVAQVVAPSGDTAAMALVQTSGSCAGAFASPTWQPFAPTSTFVLTGGSGAKTVCVIFRDETGNFDTAAATSASLTLDTVPPTNPIFNNLSSGTTSALAVPISASASVTAIPDTIDTAPVYQCYGGQYGDAWTDCGTTSPLAAFTLRTNKENTLGVRSRDAAYNYSAGTLVRIVHDDTSPAAGGTIRLVGSLGDGNTSPNFTTNPAVVAQLSNMPGDGDAMALVQAPGACSAAFGAASWQAKAPTATVVLTGSDGPKTVCVLFRDTAGNFNLADATSASITLDTAAPSDPAFTNLSSMTTSVAVQPPAAFPTITASTDNLGGTVTFQCLGGVLYPAWGDCGTSTTLPAPFTLKANQENTLGVRARDAAYNSSSGSVIRVTHDNTPPLAPTITSTRSTLETISLTWSPSPSNDVAGYRVNYGNGPGDLSGTGAAQGPSPVDASLVGAFQLSGLTPGVTYYVSVVAVDAAGNPSPSSGERLAVPNRVNPRLIATFGADFRAVGASGSRIYVAQNQGIIQLDASADASTPTFTGRATIPNLVPSSNSPMPVVPCSGGDCVYVTGSTLEADFRADTTATAAGVYVVFFRSGGTASSPVLGQVVTSIPARPEQILYWPGANAGSSTDDVLFAVEKTKISAWSLANATVPTLLSTGNYGLGGEVIGQIYGAGIIGTNLYFLGLTYGGATFTRVYRMNIANPSALPGVDFFTVNQAGGGNFGPPASGGVLPSPAFFGGLFIGYMQSNVMKASAYNFGTTAPASTATLHTSGAANGAYLIQDTTGSTDHFYVFCRKCDASTEHQGYRVNTPTATTFGTVVNVPFHAANTFGGSHNTVAHAAISTYGGVEHLLAVDYHDLNYGPPGMNQPEITFRRWTSNSSTVTALTATFADGVSPVFAEGQGFVFLARGWRIRTVDVSNPLLPQVVSTFDGSSLRTGPGGYGNQYINLVVHGQYLYAGVERGNDNAPNGGAGVDIFKIRNDGTLVDSSNTPGRYGNTLSSSGTNARAIAVAGKYLYIGGGGIIPPFNFDLIVVDVSNPASPAYVTYISAAMDIFALDVRADSIYAASNTGQFQVFAFTGSTVTARFVTPLSPPASFETGTVNSVVSRGDQAIVSDPFHSFGLDVSYPTSPYYTGTEYRVSGPVKLQGGYLVGLDPGLSSERSPTSVPESGPRFTTYYGAAQDGTVPFATCGREDASKNLASHASRNGVYYASCNRNGTQIMSPVNSSGGRLLKRYDEAWWSGAALATDGMYVFLGGLDRGSSATLFTENEYLMASTYPVATIPAFNSNSSTVPQWMSYADGVNYVMQSGQKLVAYNVSAPGSAWPVLGNYSLPFASGTIPVPPVMDGDYMCIQNDATTVTRIFVLDIRDPKNWGTTSPLKSTITVTGSPVFRGMALGRHRLYAAQNGPTPVKIAVWGVENPAAPAARTAVSFSGYAPVEIHDLTVAGKWLFLATSASAYNPPYGLAMVKLGSNGDGSGAQTLAGYAFFTSQLPLGNPVVIGDVLYARHNLGIATFDLTPLWSAGGAPIYLGSQGHNEARFSQDTATFLVDGPFAYLLGGGSYRVFDLR